MPLEFTIESLEQVDEHLRPFYAQGEDGKFQLHEPLRGELAGLKSALDKERQARTAAEKERKAALAERERFRDLDPDRYQEALAKLEEIEARSLGEKGKFDPENDDVKRFVEKRVEKVRTELQAALKAAEKKAADAEAAKAQVEERYQTMVLTSQVSEAALKAGVRKDAIRHVLMTARQVFRLEDGKPVARDEDQAVILGPDHVTPLTLEDWLSSHLRKEAPFYFEASGGGASGTSASGAPASGRKPSEMTTAEKAEYIDKHGLEAWTKLLTSKARK